MDRKIIFASAVLIISLALAAISPAQATKPVEISLSEGKNNLTVEEFIFPKYVSDLVKENPWIESVTLKENGRSYGYINIFGGIGRNFLIEYGKTYEIFSSQNKTMVLAN